MSCLGSSRSGLIYTAQALTLSLAYLAAAMLGLRLAPADGFATFVWAPAGISLAALVLGGARLWPGVAVGALLTSLAAGSPPLLAAGFTLASTAAAVAGATVLCGTAGFRGSLARWRDLTGLLAAAVVSASLGASMASLSLLLWREAPADVARLCWAWWTGNLLGVLAVVPLLLTAAASALERPAGDVDPRAGDHARGWLAAIVESSSDAIIGKTPEGIISSWNAAAERLYGYSREEAVGQSIAMLVPPERHAEIAWLLDQMRRGARVEGHETIRVRKDGTRIAVALTLSPIRDDAGRTVGSSVIARDLTDSVELLRLACEAACVGAWYWTPKNNRLVWTPCCRAIFGLGADEVISYARYLEAVHPDDRERLARAVADAIEAHTELHVEHRVVWPDGSVHWVAGCGRVLYDDDGAPLRMMGTAVEITRQKQADEERAELLRREQAARAEAQAATQAKDEFLATLSHELRTPLQAMLGWTSMLKGRLQHVPLAHKPLDAIERNVTLQARLIEDLLDVSRIVAGKLRLARERVDLAAVIGSVLESMTALAETKGVLLDTPPRPPTEVVGDPVRLQQVVSNLLTNAIKFTPAGGRVGVRLERDEAVARIVVEDSGRGISAEFLPHVFDRFRQAERTTVHARGGLGLGLAIVHHLVELHQGTVQVESPGEGKGATFTVTLPLVGAEASPVVTLRRKPGGRPARAPTLLAGERVLVVDDDPDACDLLTAVLHEAGAEARAVHSARAALDSLDDFRPHLLLSDIGMPGEDGYSLILRVREREETEGGHLPAVALTAFASHSDREQALASGFDAYLAKPVTPELLTETLASLAEPSP